MRMLLALPLHPRCRFSAHARRLNERLTKSLSTLPRGLGVDPNPVRPTSLDRRPAQLGAGGHAELCTTSCAQHCTGKARRLAGVFCPSWQGYAPSWDVLNATSGHDDRHESGWDFICVQGWWTYWLDVSPVASLISQRTPVFSQPPQPKRAWSLPFRCWRPR